MANYDVQRTYDPKNKVKFTIDNVDKFVIDHGAYTLWEKSYICPCRSQDTGSASAVCPRCKGVGFSYHESVPTVVMYQNQDKGVSNGDISLTHAGTAIGTTTKEDKISFRDRLTIPESTVPQSILVEVTKQSVESGIFLHYEVEEVTYACTDNGPLNNVKIVDNFYYPDKSLVGEYVSFNLDVLLRYYVVDVLKENRYQFDTDPRKANQFARAKDKVNLTRKLLIRREDMFVPDIISENYVAETDNSLELRANLDNNLRSFF